MVPFFMGLRTIQSLFDIPPEVMMKPAFQCFSMIPRKALTAAISNQCFWVLCQFPLTSRQWKWRIIVNILTVRQLNQCFSLFSIFILTTCQCIS